MRQGEKGFTLIEFIVAISIIALIASAAAVTTFQVINGTGRSNSHMTSMRQVQNAGYWISRDARMAESIITDNLSSPNFVILNWAERDYGSDSTYHSVTYFFEDLSDGIGKLKRSHWSSAGANDEMLVAEYIYYDPGDSGNTSNASYQKPVLTLQLVAQFGDAQETREYRVNQRQTFN